MSLFQNHDFIAVLPEVIVAVCAMALLMAGVTRKGEVYRLVAMGANIAILITVLFVAAGTAHGTVTAFDGSWVVDHFARAMKVLVLAGTEIALVLSTSYFARRGLLKFEYPVLLLLAALGMMMMISANDLITLYVGLELQSLALYVVAAFDRDNTKSSEAGLKYFVLGSLSSGMLLYGASLIYGFSGTTTFSGISAALSGAAPQIGVIFGLVFIVAGLAFKVSAVPFHMWTPDVYEGAPTPVATFFAAAPKVAAMALFVRVMMGPFASIVGEWRQIITFISIASMVLGAFAAIGQTNIKRLMAYSSISHMGFALVGLAAAGPEGVRSVILYMFIYVVTVTGAFACILAMRRNGQQVENIADLSGLARTNKVLAFILAALMFSLAGIPPLAGFFGKFFVFLAAIKSGLIALSVIGVIASVVGAFYYLRIVKMMYFDEPALAFDKMDREVRYAAIISGAFAILFAIFAQPIINFAAVAAQSLN